MSDPKNITTSIGRPMSAGEKAARRTRPPVESERAAKKTLTKRRAIQKDNRMRQKATSNFQGISATTGKSFSPKTAVVFGGGIPGTTEPATNSPFKVSVKQNQNNSVRINSVGQPVFGKPVKDKNSLKRRTGSAQGRRRGQDK
jgi:hypothetical protein